MLKNQIKSAADSIYQLIRGTEAPKYLSMISCLCIVLALGNIMFSFGMGQLFTHTYQEKFQIFIYPLLLLLSGKVVYAVAEFLKGRLEVKLQANLNFHYRMIIAEKYAKAKYEWQETQKTGDLVDRVQEDTDSAAMAVATYLPKAVKSLVIFGVTIFVLFSVDWRLSVAYLFPVPFLFIFNAWGSKVSQRYFDDSRVANSARNAKIQDVINNRTTIKAYSLEDTVEREIENKILCYVKKISNALAMMPLSFSPAILFNKIPSILLGVIGCALVIQNNLHSESFIMIFTLSITTADEIRELDDFMANIPSLLAYAKRLFPIWDSPQQVFGREIACQDTVHAFELENVSFAYSNVNFGASKILTDFNLRIKKGERVVIVGKSGSGKSTVLKLAGGLYEPSRGTIKIFGRKIEDWDERIFHQLVGYMSQDIFLWPMSIEENIQLAQSNRKIISLEQAVKFSGITGSLNKLSDGLKTQVGERGTSLSGGQR
ncbi:ABC transporter transmembrane domain-containing protein [Sporomusa rhizae]|uniref:ABC transporter transmembrane domain-containing protein n=1 Tax=Sporomusa rhizae TaxID=357999 RepID=UPI00352AD19A